MTDNVKACSEFRSYNTDIPDFLKNRPSTFVKHCLQRLQRAEDIPLTAITDSEEDPGGPYFCQSQTTKGVVYTITMMPLHCQCPDWARYHMPCKHILCILVKIAGCSWNNVDQAYRNSPFINLDLERYDLEQSNDMEMMEQEQTNLKRPVSVVQLCSPETDVPVCPSPNLNRERQTALDALKHLQNLVYACSDSTTMSHISKELLQVVKKTEDKIPHSGPFVANVQPITTAKKRKTSRKMPTRSSLVSLKIQRRQPFTGRTGKKATMMRRHYTRLGAKALLTHCNYSC